jgi:hypothetical protein
MSSKKNMSSGRGFKNKRMNEHVYSERRQVMNHIYTAKNLLRSKGIEMPRIDIRIVDADRNETRAIGRGRFFGNIVWIPSDALIRYKRYMYQIVLHELCHTLWGIKHNEKCKLMSSCLDVSLSDKDSEKLFLSYIPK